MKVLKKDVPRDGKVHLCCARYKVIKKLHLYAVSDSIKHTIYGITCPVQVSLWSLI